MSKITLGQSIKIKNLIASGSSADEVASLFGITRERALSFCPKVKKNASPKKRAKRNEKKDEEAQEGNEEKKED